MLSPQGRSDEMGLHEALLLLILKDAEGTIDWRATHWPLALGGALLAELVLRERVHIGEDKKQRVEVVDERQTGDELLDECLAKLDAARRPANAQTWVARFSQLRKLRDRVALRLVKRGVLKVAEGQVLLIFKRTLYPEIDPQPERELVTRMKRAIIGDTVEVDARTGLLIALASVSGVLQLHFDKRMLRENKQRVKQIVDGQRIGTAAKAAIAAAQAAVVACTTAAIIAASASSS